MKKDKVSLKTLRQKTDTIQSKLLQQIWEYELKKQEWPTLRGLFRDHGKEQVTAALTSLGGNVGWEENGPGRWSRFRLSLLGTLLTQDGQRLQSLMTRFFQFQRDLFQSEPDKEQSSSNEAQKHLSLSDEETALLGHLLWLGGFGGGRNPTN